MVSTEIAMKPPETRDPVLDPEPEPIEPEPIEPEPAPRRDPEPPPMRDDPPPRDPGDGWRTEGRKEVTPKDQDPLFRDPAWIEAESAYRSGLELYRGSFGVSPRSAAISIRAALKEFRNAQDQLDRLYTAYPDHYMVEQRQQEVAKLVIDCIKRQRVGD